MDSPYQPPQYSQAPQYVDSRRKTLKLKRVGVLSSGIFGCVAGGIGGLLVGIFAALFSLAAPRPGFAPVVVLIMAPIVYGLLGFLGGMLNAAIYNIVAGMTGGIEMEFGDD